MKRYKIGVDIGGTNIAAAMYDENYNIISRKSIPFPKGEDVYFVSELIKRLSDDLAYLADRQMLEVESLGVAVPGSIDSKGETVIDAHNLGFFDAPLLKALKEAFKKECESGLKIALINDADAATLAEHKKGALRNCNTAAMLTLGTGVGGGLIINGKLFRGGRGSGTEIGHIIIEQGGDCEEKCTCGNVGCAEALCSATWLIKQGRKHFCGMIKETVQGKEENVTAKTVIDCAKKGDETALKIFEKYTDSLSSLTASIINLLDVEKIALGGGVSGAGDFLIAPVNEKVHKKSFFRTHGEIITAHFENDAGILGAALVHEY